MTMTSRPTVLASTVLALALLGDSLLYAVLPLHVSTFGVSLAFAGVLLSANRLIRLFAYPFLPAIAAAGLRRFTSGAATVGAASTLTFALASGPWPLLASRVAWGVAFGCLSLSTLAYATAFREEAGARAGLSYALREVGPLFSLTAGIAAVATFGIRPALAALGVASLAGIWVATLLPEGTIERDRGSTIAIRQRWTPEGLGFFAGLVADGVFPATIGLLLARTEAGTEAVIAAGLFLGFKRIALVVLGPLAGRAADRFGGSFVASAGFATAAFGALLIAAGGIVAGGILLSCGAAVATTTIPLSASSGNAMERLRHFARIGVARDAGAAAGPMVALTAFDAGGAAIIYGMAGAFLAVMALWLAWARFSQHIDCKNAR